MPVYRLEPIAEKVHHKSWRVSELPPTPVWVRAANPLHARLKLDLARLPTTSYVGRPPSSNSPWTNAFLVSCVEDRTRDIPEHVVLMANGKITLVLA